MRLASAQAKCQCQDIGDEKCMPPYPSCQLHLSVGPKCPHREMKVSKITPCVISQSNINNSLTLLVFLFLLGRVTRGIIARKSESRTSNTIQQKYFTHLRAKEIEMANNDNGAPQGRPNDSRLEELQSQLQEQRVEMAQIREQITALTRMVGSLMDMVQNCTASSISPPPVVGESN